MTTVLPRPRSRRWIVFFAILALLGFLAIVAPLIYNLSIQLQPEQLDAARLRWRERAYTNYDLECLRQVRSGGEEVKSQYIVRIRDGRISLVAEDGELLYAEPSLAVFAGSSSLCLAMENPRRYDMVALFDEIEKALRQSAAAKRKFYLKADFENDGHPSHFVSYDPSTKDRIELFIKLSINNSPRSGSDSRFPR
jgi:hypothetical protein